MPDDVLYAMFIHHETAVALDFVSAAARLANLARGDGLLTASRTAYEDGVTGLMAVGPAPGLSRLVRVQIGELAYPAGAASLPVRWHVEGAGERLFPALDADIRVLPADEVTMLRLDGVYRAPLGPAGAVIDRAVLHAVATATVHRFLEQVSGLIAPSPGGAGRPAGQLRPEPGTA